MKTKVVHHNISKQGGQTLLEVLVAIAFFALIVSALASLATGGLTGIQRGGDQTEAEALVQEGFEAIRSIRDDAWSNLLFSTSSVSISGGGWVFDGASTTEIIGDFTRTILFNDVCRDALDDLTPCPGAYTDVHTKEVAISVSWEPRPGVTNISEWFSHITNWEVREWLQTDWSGGSGYSIWSDLNPNRYDIDDGNVNSSIVGEITVNSTETSGGSLSQWIPGGGFSETHTSPNDFNSGTFVDTVVVGNGPSASVQLDSTAQWNGFVSTTESGSPQRLNAVHFASSTLGYSVGRNGTIMKWDGLSWGAQTSPTTKELFGVYVRTASDVWAVGLDGTIIHFNGFGWNIIQSASIKQLNDVHMVSETEGWIIANGGEIQKWNGAVWTAFTSPTSKDLNGISFVSASDGWAVGSKGTIIHYNGTSWSTFASPNNRTYNAIDMFDTNNGWIAGQLGTILYYDGVSWVEQATPINQHLLGISSVSTTEVWVSGVLSTILETGDGGTTWLQVVSPVEGPTGPSLRGIDMISASDGQIVGGKTIKPTIERWNGSFWDDIVDTLGSDEVFDLHMFSASDGWAVGNKGIILSWNGFDWISTSTPTTETLHGLDFFDITNGWAVGNKGTIAHDDGEIFSLQTSGTNQRLYEVSAVSSTQVWVAGANGTILTTTDGGVNWTAQISNTAVDLKSIDFVDAFNGWAVGVDGVIISTSDGATWSAQTSGTINNLNDVFFLDSNDGWAVGDSGTMLRTINGGSTWVSEVSSTTENLLTVHFLTTSDGWALGANGEAIHWDGVEWSLDNSTVNQDMNTVFMVSTNDVWGAGELSTFIHFFPSFFLGGTYTSSVIDSGDPSVIWSFLNWTEDITPAGTDITIDTRTGTGTVPDVSWSGFVGAHTNPIGEVINSPDVRYLQYQVTFATNDPENTPELNDITLHYNDPTTQNLFAVDMVATTSGFVSGSNSSVFSYNGVAWQEKISGGGVDYNDVFFIDTSEGWAVGDSGTIRKTSNGGNSFTTQTSGITGNIEAVYFIDANNGWVAGVSGVVLNTTDGGSNWVAQSSTTTTPADLDSIFFVDTSNGWAAGAAGVIINTTDGGATWSTQTSGTANTINEILFTSSTEGWAVGDAGTILHTTDAGVNWITRLSPTANNLNGMDFFSTNNGWAVGDAGTIVQYEGIDWAFFTSPVTDNLNDISFGSATDGWAVGDNGLFIHFVIVFFAGNFESDGSFISSAFDMGGISTVETIEWDQVIPGCAPSCTILFQLSTALDTAGSPGIFSSWYGDTGVDTFIAHQVGGSIAPAGLPSNQWVRYRAFFSGDGQNTPVLEEVKINYR